MRVLGIDPGTIVTGWGVIEKRSGRLAAIAAGVIRAGDGPLEGRLLLIHRGLGDVVRAHAPTVCAIEDVFYSKNAKAALKLGHARGVALLVAAEAGLPVHAYAPALVKRTVAGRGAAEKQQVGRLVGAILGLVELPAADATDALAIAITHAQASAMIAALDAAGANASARRRARRRR